MARFVFDGPQDMPLEQPKKKRFVFDEPAKEEPSAFENFANAGARTLTERGIGIIQLLDEATGGALLSPAARDASYRAMQKSQQEAAADDSVMGMIGGVTADPLMALPFAKGLQGIKGLATSGAVAGGASEALRGKTNEEEDRLANTGAGTLVGGIAGPIAGKVMEAVASPVQTAKNVISGVGRAMKVSPEAVRTFEEAGLSPLVGDVSKSGRVQRMQNMAEDAPLVGAITTSAKNRMEIDVKNNLAKIGFDESAERVVGGNAAKQGLTNYVNKGKAIFGKAFDEFDRKFVNSDEKTLLSNTTTKINDILSRADTPEALDAYLGSTEKSIIAKIQAASEPDIKPSTILDSSGIPFAVNPTIIGKPPELTYNDVKLFRTSIGKKLEDYTIGSSDKAILRELYGSLTQDMRSKAQQKGSKALETFDRLNGNYSKFMTKLDDTINEVLNKGETTEIFNAVRTGLPLPERTATIMRAMPQKNRDIVRGSLIRELGVNRTKAGQGEFDVGKFVTSYNALEPKAQNALLVGLPKDVQNNFKKVMQASTLALKTGLQSNPSGTARNAGLVGIGGGLVTAPITTLSLLGGGAITAKMMTSPKFIKWLANAPKQTGSKLTNYVARLSAIAASDAANREDIENYQQQMQNP